MSQWCSVHLVQLMVALLGAWTPAKQLGQSSFSPENDATIRVPAPSWKIPNGASSETVDVFVDVWSVAEPLKMSESPHSTFVYARPSSTA